MTAQINVNAAQQTAEIKHSLETLTGERKEGFSTVHVAGVVGGIMGALAAHGEGNSITASVIGGVAGAAAGYAAASAIGGRYYDSNAAQILGGLASGLFGAGIAGTIGGLANSICKIADAQGSNE